MDIGEVLTRAWQIVWKHKVLWLFGILAGLGASGANTSAGSGQGSASTGMENWFQNTFGQMPDWQIVTLALVVFFVVLVITLLIVFLATVGRIGLIRGTYEADQGAARLQFGELFRESTPYFWRIFGLQLLIVLAVIVMVVIITLLAIPLALTVVGLFCLIPVICLLPLIAIALNLVIEQASIAIVIDDLGIGDGLQRGWQIVRDNLGAMILLALVLYLGVSLIGGLILGLPIALIVFPLFAGAAIGTERASSGGLIIAGLCLIVYLPFLIALTGLLQSYVKSAWTLAYMRLTGRQPVAVTAG